MSKISFAGNLSVNTGTIAADYMKGNPQMLFIGGSFQPSDYATAAAFQTAIISKIKLPRGNAGKIYPIPAIQGNTDKTTAAKFGTLGYGLPVKLMRSRAAYELDLEAGSTLEKQMIQLDNKQLPVIILDDSDVFGGVKDVNGVFSGATFLVSVEPRGYGDANSPKTTKVTLSLINPKDFVENFFGVSAVIPTTSMAGLNDVTLEEISAHTTNVYHIKPTVYGAVSGQSQNLAALYGATLASSSLWAAKTGTGFTTTLAITSVALDANGDGYDITLDTTAYSALSAGASIQINLADPATLDAANVTEVEGTPIVVTK